MSLDREAQKQVDYAVQEYQKELKNVLAEGSSIPMEKLIQRWTQTERLVIEELIHERARHGQTRKTKSAWEKRASQLFDVLKANKIDIPEWEE